MNSRAAAGDTADLQPRVSHSRPQLGIADLHEPRRVLQPHQGTIGRAGGFHRGVDECPSADGRVRGRIGLRRWRREPVPARELRGGALGAAARELQRAKELLLHPVGRDRVELLVGLAERRDREVQLGDGLAQAIEQLLALYSHSMVPGGFEVMSSTTRFTWRISLIIREAIFSSRS